MVILITGASSGIGRSTAEYLTKIGHTVYGTFRKTPTETLVFHPILMDVTNQSSVDEAIKVILQNENRLDVLINNAGLGMISAIEEAPEEMIQRLFDTNVWGLMRVCKAVLPTMRKQDNGLIINVSSIAGTMGLPFRGLYSASKAAVEMITEALSLESKAFGIKVCSVLPGDVRTNINQNRMVAECNEQSPYFKTVTQMNAKVNAEVSSAAEPEYIAKTIEKILKSSSPRLHYVAGPPLQKISIWLKRLLPDRMYEKMLMGHYGLKSVVLALFCSTFLSCQSNDNQTHKKTYFDINGFVKSQIEWLNNTKPMVVKNLTMNKRSESLQTDSLNWEKEFELFLQADINKPALSLSYDSSKTEYSTLYTLKKGEHLAVKNLKITLDSATKKPSKIEALITTENLLYDSSKKLTMFCRQKANRQWGVFQYFIEGTQKIVLTDKESFSIIGKIK